MTEEQFNMVMEWQTKTFGQAHTLSKMAHLEAELLELQKEVKFQKEHSEHVSYKDANKIAMESEFADCFILLFGVASSAGMSYDDIVRCINEKMEINKKRKWGKPDKNGVVNHIK